MGDCCCDGTVGRAQAIMKKVPPCTSKSLTCAAVGKNLLFKQARTRGIMRPRAREGGIALRPSSVLLSSLLYLVSAEVKAAQS